MLKQNCNNVSKDIDYFCSTTHTEDRLGDLDVGSEFMRLGDDNTYLVIDRSILDCLKAVIIEKLIPVLNLKDYKVYIFHEDTVIRRK